MNKHKIIGALYGVAIGDAMGAPTELRNTEQIKNTFGGYVTDFVESPEDTFSAGYPVATVTDDYSLSHYLIKEIIKCNGVFDVEAAKQAIINWGNDEIYFDKFSGPTTRRAIDRMKEGLPTDIDPFGLINFNAQATNGGAMKVTPVALLANGDLEKSVNYAFDLCKPTHFNSNAISAACAVSCAITNAYQDDSTIESIIESALFGAKEGRAKGEEANKISVGIDISKAIKRAVSIANECTDDEQLMYQLSELVGTSFNVSESVPCLFGILSYAQGDFNKSIFLATNIGGDTDTMAAMLGGITGAYQGVEVIKDSWMKKVNESNPGLNIETNINQFADFLSTIN